MVRSTATCLLVSLAVVALAGAPGADAQAWRNMNQSAFTIQRAASNSMNEMLAKLGRGQVMLGEPQATPDAQQTCPDGSREQEVTTAFNYMSTAFSTVFTNAINWAGNGDAFVLAMLDESRNSVSGAMRSLEFGGGISGGYGAGFGFTIQCNNQVKFGWGMGFGGGASNPENMGFGGGGGAQAVDSSGGIMDFGGGVGCGAGITGCGSALDANSVTSLYQILEKALADIETDRDCSVSQQICADAGGGGGVHGSCDWGAGFSMQGTTRVRGPTQACNNGGAAGSGDPGTSARTCSASCSSNPDFNSCFKDAVTAKGASWGPKIQCH